jgi:hypothetical protein
MREIMWMLGVTAVSLSIIGGAVFAGGDRALFVPPPEMATEDFTRAVTTRRFDIAMKLLSSRRQRSETPETIARRFAAMFAAVGEVNSVDAELRWMDTDRASATATVEGDAGSLSFDFSLVRESGLWKIDELPELSSPDS